MLDIPQLSLPSTLDTFQSFNPKIKVILKIWTHFETVKLPFSKQIFGIFSVCGIFKTDFRKEYQFQASSSFLFKNILSPP